MKDKTEATLVVLDELPFFKKETVEVVAGAFKAAEDAIMATYSNPTPDEAGTLFDARASVRVVATQQGAKKALDKLLKAERLVALEQVINILDGYAPNRSTDQLYREVCDLANQLRSEA